MVAWGTRKNSASAKGRTFITAGIAVLCVVVLFAGSGSKTGNDPAGTQASATPPASGSPSASASATASANPAETNSSTSSASSTGPLNACDLIDKSEIAVVQGAQVQSTTPNSQTTGAILMSQCYYTVISGDGAKNLSVHLQVMRADPKDPKAVSEFWKTAFHEKDKKREKKEGPPQAVAGVGEEAFWIDSGKTGVLYALKKNSLVRLSVGGAADPKVRLEKSKTLIAKALARVA